MTDIMAEAMADRLGRRRARWAGLLGILILVAQTQSLGRPGGDALSDAAWMLWAALVAVALLFGSGLAAGRTVGALLDDELTVVNRQSALATGFWAAIGASLLLGVALWLRPADGMLAVRIVLTAAVSAALLRFGALERRAYG